MPPLPSPHAPQETSDKTPSDLPTTGNTGAPNATEALIRSCVEALFECVSLCETCAAACLDSREGGRHRDGCIKTCQECSELCSLTARLLLRQSALVPQVCETCAFACELCADNCRGVGNEECANACQECVTLCREIVSGQTA